MAANFLVKERNTNFDSLIKNLENNRELYDLVYDIIVNGMEKSYNQHNPLISLGETFGVFREDIGKLRIHNRIYEQIIYNYMISKLEMVVDPGSYQYRESFLANGKLNLKQVLMRFQQFMKEEYSDKDADFLERNGRLLFLAFLKPIINGQGFDFKEVQISEERRLDVLITYRQQRYVVELKLWRGAKAHEKGLRQLHSYLEALNLDQGYLVIYDLRNKRKEWKQDSVMVDGKEIFVIWV